LILLQPKQLRKQLQHNRDAWAGSKLQPAIAVIEAAGFTLAKPLISEKSLKEKRMPAYLTSPSV
jgi:hypothetical protein